MTGRRALALLVSALSLWGGACGDDNPTGGNKSFDPPEWDARLGALWPRAVAEEIVTR